MTRHLAGLVGILAGIAFLAIGALIVNYMLESIPHTKPKPQPREVSVGVIAEPAPATAPANH